ncbi:MAG: hypothetical protein WC327_05100 [Candidatus Cloacimonadia bacterium]
MSKQSIVSQLRDELVFRSGGKLQVNLPVKNELKHLATNTIHNYLQLPLGVQLAVQWSYSIQGKYGAKERWLCVSDVARYPTNKRV